jgi:hypothetical protein
VKYWFAINLLRWLDETENDRPCSRSGCQF